MRKDKKSLPGEYEKYTKSLEKSFQRWEEIRTHGCSDPFWADGVNMNLVRNHIIYEKRELERICQSSLFRLPDIYHKETPEKVDPDYMARPEEIRRNAIRTLDTLQASPEYEYLSGLRDMAQGLKSKSALRYDIFFALSRVDNIRTFLEKDNLVDLRRQEDTEKHMALLREMAKKIRERIENNEQDVLVPDEMMDEPSGPEEEKEEAEACSPAQEKEASPATEQLRLF